jgi:TIR domain
MTLNYSLVVNVCCCHSCSHKDVRLWKELEKQLAPLVYSQQIILWNPGDIRAGQTRKQEIEFRVASADVVLLLISADFLSSSFGREQMGLALYRFYQQKICTIPILLHPSTWELSPVFQLEPLPSNRRPISTWSKPDLALLEVAKGIHSVIMRLQPSPRNVRNQPTDVHRKIFSVPSISWGAGIVPSSYIVARNLEELTSALRSSTSGTQVSGKYKLVGEPLAPSGIILQHLPLGIPGFTPVSVSIDTADRTPQNMTTPSPTMLTSGGVMIYGYGTNEDLPCEAAGNITITY